MSEQSARAVGDGPFEPEDFAFTAKLLRDHSNTDRSLFQAVCSNNLNIILAALDAEAIRDTEKAVIRAARTFHDVATNLPVVSDEWAEAWRALGAEIETLDYVMLESPDPPAT